MHIQVELIHRTKVRVPVPDNSMSGYIHLQPQETGSLHSSREEFRNSRCHWYYIEFMNGHSIFDLETFVYEYPALRQRRDRAPTKSFTNS